MNDAGPNGISQRILDEVLKLHGLQSEQSARIGRIEGQIEGINAHCARVNRRLGVGSKRMKELGERMTRLEQHQADADAKAAGFGVELETGGEELASLKAQAERKAAADEAVKADRAHRWQRFAWIVGVAISLCGLTQAGKCVFATKAAPAAPDAAVQAARR